MKRADVFANGMNYLNRIVVTNVAELIEYHEVKHGAKFDETLKSELNSMKDIFAIPQDFKKRLNRIGSHHTYITFENQLRHVLTEDFLGINEAGGYFPFSKYDDIVYR